MSRQGMVSITVPEEAAGRVLLFPRLLFFLPGEVRRGHHRLFGAAWQASFSEKSAAFSFVKEEENIVEDSQELTLVSAPNPTGEAFIRQLLLQQLPFAVMVNNKQEQSRLTKLGVKHFLLVDTTEQLNWTAPAFQVGSVFLFENSFNLCCRYIQMCRRWTANPIYVITHTNHPRLVYRGLGANYVIHSNSDEIPFLLQTLVE